MRHASAKYALAVLVTLTLTVIGCERDHSGGYSHQGNKEAVDSLRQPDNLYEEPNEANTDNDRENKSLPVAEKLNGTWEGSLDIVFYDDAGRQHSGHYLMRLSFEQYKRNTLNGTGVENDFDEGGEKIYHAPFTWFVDTGNQAIHMKFSEREMVVFPYEIDDKHFSGTMKTIDGLETDQFSLLRIF